MGLFGLTKDKKEKKPSKIKEEPEFEIGSDGLIFTATMQILASPKEYAVKIANNFVENMKGVADLKHGSKYYILKSKISKPEKLKDEEKDMKDKHESETNIFKILIDLEIGVKNKANIFDFCFDYMPFMIEVVEPANVSFGTHEFNDYLANIQATLHKIDEALKKTNAANQIFARDNKILLDNMIRTIKNNVLLSLKEGNKEAKDLAKNVGLPEQKLKQYLDQMVEDKEIVFDNKKYSRIKKSK